MRHIPTIDAGEVAGGGIGEVLGVISDTITLLEAAASVVGYFAQDNGGPSAADWAASVGYVG